MPHLLGPLSHKKNINKIESVQKRAARFVLRDYTYNSISDQILNKLKWTTLQNRRAIRDLVIFNNIRLNKINITFPPCIQLSPRHPNRYIPLQALHSDIFKYHFYSRTIRLWNQLPVNATNSQTHTNFKGVAEGWINQQSWSSSSGTLTLI